MSNLDLTEELRIQNQKINYFNSKVGNTDDEKAISYLIEANWDERRAVQIFMDRNQPQIPPLNNYNQPQPKKEPPINLNLIEFQVSEALLDSNATYQNKDSVNFTNFVKYINGQFSLTAKSYNNFIKLLKQHAGIIILLTLDTFDRIKRKIQQIKSNSLCSDIIRNSILFPIMKDSPLGNEFVEQLQCISFPSYIFCKYKDNKSIYITGRIEGSINANSLIDNVLNAIPDTKANIRTSLKSSLNASININKSNNNVNDNIKKDNNIDDTMWNYNDFCLGTSMELNKLIEQLGISDNYNNNNNNYNNNYYNNFNNNQNLNNNNQNLINNNQNLNNNNQNLNNNNQNPVNDNVNNNKINLEDSIAGLSAGEINAKREREIRELEREHEEKMKKEEEEKQKIIEENNRKKKLIEDYEREAERCKNFLLKEPDENDPNACHIIFRYPEGSKTNERRFFKNEKVEILFYYVKSLGTEIYSENDYKDFDLVYGFPPKIIENTKERTLEEEGLCPRCIIQIREK